MTATNNERYKGNSPEMAGLNGTILSFIAEHVPDNNDPICSWYHKQYLKRGQGFAPYGDSIALFLSEHGKQFDRLTEIGAGIGQSCIQFAAQGWDTVAVENGTLQYSLMEQLLDRVKAVAPAVRARIETHRLAFPEQVESYFNERTIGCFFGLCSSGAPEEPMIAALRLAGGVIMETRTYFKARDPEEQLELIKKIVKLGFESPIPIWDSSAHPDFWTTKLVYFKKAR